MSTTLTIDKAGRIVLPKRIRDRLHLRTGSRLRVVVSGDTVELSPEAEGATVIKRRSDGLPVVVGWNGFDAAKAVNEAREDQLNRLDKQP